MIDPYSKAVAVIPARGGSKGIPKKNLLQIGGRPLIEWTLEAVVEATNAFRLIVSTDSQEISQVSRDMGAEIVVRPEELGLDTTATEPVISHALAQLGIEGNTCLVILQATSPIRSSGTLDSAYETFLSSGSDSLLAVVEEAPFLWRGPVSNPTATYNVAYRPRRQDFKPNAIIYKEVGSFYFSWVESFQSTGNRIHGRQQLFVVDKHEGIDIDDDYDAIMADAILSKRGSGSK